MFSLLQGVGHEVGMTMVKHPLTRAVAFTGSLRGGRALFDAAASRSEPIPVYAEMGSINPVFVLPEALQNRAAQIARDYVQSVNLGVGQFCTNPGLLLVPKGPGGDKLIDLIRAEAASITPAPMLHEGILNGYQEGVARIAALEDVEQITPAQGSKEPKANCELFVADASLLADHEVLTEEVFGPVSVILRCDSVDQMVTIASRLEGQLTATIHGEECELVTHARLLQNLQRHVGRLVFNGFPTGIEVCAAMHHGGPYPATTHIGSRPSAIRRSSDLPGQFVIKIYPKRSCRLS